jgi:hypothetical protein
MSCNVRQTSVCRGLVYRANQENQSPPPIINDKLKFVGHAQPITSSVTTMRPLNRQRQTEVCRTRAADHFVGHNDALAQQATTN